MFELYSAKAIRAVIHSQDESRRTRHNFVGTEQILLGLIREGTGVAALTLASMGVNLNDARVGVERIIRKGNGSPAEIPFTPGAKKLFEFSLMESKNLGHDCIDTEHLLLGLIREGEGVVRRVLENLGVDVSVLRNRTLANISQTSNPVQQKAVAQRSSRHVNVFNFSNRPWDIRFEMLCSTLAFTLVIAIPVSLAIKFLAYLPAFWRPAILTALGLPDGDFPPFILDFFGLNFGHSSCIAHWKFVLVCSFVVYGLLRLDFWLRCPGSKSCSDQFYKQVIFAVQKLPPEIQVFLAEKRCRLLVLSKVVAVKPLLLYKTPSGYSNNASYEVLCGTYLSHLNLIVIGELYKKENRWIPINKTGISSLVAHETGHALDDHLDYFSQTEQFNAAHDSDCGSLSDNDKDRLKYYIQNNSPSGRRESFAEIAASLTGSHRFYVADIDLRFPKTARLVQSKLEEKLLLAKRPLNPTNRIDNSLVDQYCDYWPY